MNNQGFENQFEMARQMAQQSGMSGAVYIDYDPANGFLRLKLKVTPPEQQTKLTSSFGYVLAQMCQAFGLQVNVHQRKGEEAGH